MEFSIEKPLIMVPGPTEIPARVIQAMMRPAEVHYAKHFNIEVFEETLLKMREIFKTRNEIFAFPGSGRVGQEAAIASVVDKGDKVLTVIAGEFGRWMAEMVKRVGGTPVEFRVKPGRKLDLERLKEVLEREEFKALTIVHNETSTGAVYPIKEIGKLTKKHDVIFIVDTISSLGAIDVRTDEWNIDFNVACSHKCLCGPIGLSIVAVSEKGWEAMENRRNPPVTFSYDLLKWKHMWLPKERGGKLIYGWRRPPITIPVHLVYGLREAVEMVLEEGLERRFKRHEVMAKTVREAVKEIGLELFPEEEIASNTVTAVKIPSGVDDREFREKVLDQGVLIAGGLSELRGKIFRIGHMGETASKRFILPTIAAIEVALKRVGFKVDLGSGLRRAQEILSKEDYR